MRFVRALALCFALGAGGCLSVGGDAAPAVEHVHALGTVGVPAGRTSLSADTLAIHAFRARKRFDERLVRQDPDGRLAVLESERWAEEPAEATTDAIREALAASGLFAGVFPSAEGTRATRALHGFVLGFHIVRPASGPWATVFRVRLDLVETKTETLLRSGVYEGSAALADASTQGLGEAMTKSVEEGLSAAIADWVAAGVLR